MPKFLTKEQKHEGVRISQKWFLTTTTHQICHLLTLFSSQKVKEQYTIITLTQDTFKSNLERAIRTISA
jgi:hypothetical protein